MVLTGCAPPARAPAAAARAAWLVLSDLCRRQRDFAVSLWLACEELIGSRGRLHYRSDKRVDESLPYVVIQGFLSTTRGYVERSLLAPRIAHTRAQGVCSSRPPPARRLPSSCIFPSYTIPQPHALFCALPPCRRFIFRLCLTTGEGIFIRGPVWSVSQKLRWRVVSRRQQLEKCPWRLP